MSKAYYSKNHYKVGNVKFTLDLDGLEQAIDYALICKLDIECVRNGWGVDIIASYKEAK